MNTSHISINKHTSIRLEGSSVVYIDPFELEVSPRDADVVCITHSHFDHFSPDDIDRVAQEHTKFVIPAGMESDISSLTIDKEQLIVMSIGETVSPVEQLSIEAVAAYNVGKAFHPKENGWVGYVIELDGKRHYIVGDSDNLEENHGVSCDIVCVPVGGTYTMDCDEAAAFVSALKPQVAIPTHYGSVVGTPEMGERFKSALALADPAIEVVLKY